MSAFRIARCLRAADFACDEGAAAEQSRATAELKALKAWNAAAASRGPLAAMSGAPHQELYRALAGLSENGGGMQQDALPAICRTLSTLAARLGSCLERLSAHQGLDDDDEELAALQDLTRQCIFWCAHGVQAVEKHLQAAPAPAGLQQAAGWTKARAACLEALADVYTAALDELPAVLPGVHDRLAADELIVDTILQLAAADAAAGPKSDLQPLTGLIAGHVLLSRQLVGVGSSRLEQLYINFTALMQQKGDRLAGLLADALVLALQHDQPYAVYFVAQLASSCSKDVAGQQQAPAGEAMLQVLVLVAASDAALAALILKALQACFGSSKAAVRKQLLDVAAAAVPPGGTLAQQRAGLLALLAGCSDRDGPCRAKALSALAGLAEPLWQLLLAQQGAGDASSTAPMVQQVAQLLHDRLLDKTKTARGKALQLLGALISASMRVHATAVAREQPAVQQLQQLLLHSAFPALSATLDAPENAALYSAEAAEATRQLLLSSSPILQQSGVLRKLLLGGGGGGGTAEAGGVPGTAVAEGPSDAVLQSLLVYGMPGDAKAAQDAWTDILGASSPQQVERYMRLLQQAGAPLPQLKRHAMAAVCSALSELQEQPGGAAQAQALQQLEASAKLLLVMGGAGAGSTGTDQLGEVVILLDVVDALLALQQQAAQAEAAGGHGSQAGAAAALSSGTASGSCLGWILRALAAHLEAWLQQGAAAPPDGRPAAGSAKGGHALAAASIVQRFIAHRFPELSKAGAGAADAALQLLCALPGSQAALLALLGGAHRRLQVLSCLDDSAEADSGGEGGAAWQQGATAAAVQAFLQVAAHCCSFYQHERSAFLQQLAAVRQHAGAAQEADEEQPGAAPAPPAAPAGSKRKAAAGAGGSRRKGRGQQQERGDATDAGEAAAAAAAGEDGGGQGVAYMQQEEHRRQDEAAAQEYLSQMMQGSAPACYMPLLAALAQAPGAPQGARLLALQALGQLMLLCDQVAQQHGGIIAALVASGEAAEAQLQVAALQLASSLVLHRPSANLHLMAALEAPLAASSGAAAGVAATAAALYGHVILHDKLQLTHQVFEVVAGCLEHSEPGVRAVACQVVRAMLRAREPQRHKAVLSLLAVSQQRGGRGLMQHAVLPCLGPRDLAADTLVLPVLQSLYAAQCGEAAAVACSVLSCMSPSGKALAAMLAYLEAHPKLLEGLGSACLKDLATFCSAAKVAPGRRGEAEQAPGQGGAEMEEGGGVAAPPAAAAGARLAAGREAKAKLLQLLQAAQQCQQPAAARRKRKGRAGAGGMAADDAAAAAAAADIGSYRAALRRYRSSPGGGVAADGRGGGQSGRADDAGALLGMFG